MNELQIFKNEEFGEIRTIKIDNEPWFCLSDLCKALELKHVATVKKRLFTPGVVSNDIGVQTGVKKNGSPAIQHINMLFVNEANLYKVIFQSRKESAEKFTDWVTSEVLPSIRKHGMYATKELLSNPRVAAEVLLELAKEQERNAELEKNNTKLQLENEEMKPKAEYFDNLVDKKLLTNFRDTAKELHIKPKQFINKLIEKKYIYRDKKGNIKPYQNKNNGLFELKEYANGYHLGVQTLITPKGRETFRLLFNIA